LTEQREEVSSMSALLAVVERAAETNLLLAEGYLARNPVGDEGAPESASPPAAGGAL
jgi:bacterioferritin B